VRLGVSMRPDARTDEVKAERIKRAMQLREQGYPIKVIEKRCGSSMWQMKKWAADLGLEWIAFTKGGKRL
jgi:hypothetical protein